MPDRVNPKQILQDADVQVNGSFGGLSSASYISTGDVAYADKMVNCVITNRNEIERRSGSNILSYFGSMSLTAATNQSVFSFTFDNVKYIIGKVGRTLYAYSLANNDTYYKGILKTNAFSSESVNELATFATIIEGNTCFILCATSTTNLVCLTLLKRELSSVLVPTTTTITGNITNYPDANVINNLNSFLYYDTGTFVPTSVVTQSTSSVSITSTTPHNVPAGANLVLHSFFVCNCLSAQYYPGSYLYNSAVRQNTLPLDVNVQLPTEISSNPIVNENNIQDLSFNSVDVWQTQTVQTFTRNLTNNPSTPTSWDFSDGSYAVGANNRTTRTPNFISFGGLTAGAQVERVFVYRRREVLLLPRYSLNASQVSAFIDLAPKTPVFYSTNGTVTTTGVKYFNFSNTDRPSLSSVVELVYSVGSIVNLDSNNTTVSIGDNYVIPLYGYASFCNVGNNKFPNLVLAVGNRLLLSGYDNRVTFSNSDWNYRGIGWNNFQVSTINFSDTSSYAISITQQSSIVKGISSVNGVIIVATDTGIFRISGQSAVLPPTATNANVSRVSNEILPNNECIIVYENKVFFASVNGLFQLQYTQESEELRPTPISVDVSEYFKQMPRALTYSNLYRSFQLTFAGAPRDILNFSFDSATWSTFKFSYNIAYLNINQTFDGYLASVINTGGATYTGFLMRWDAGSTTDVSNANGLLGNGASAVPNETVFTASSVLVGTGSTNVDLLSTPAELVSYLNPAIIQAYGDNNVKSVSGASVQVAEETNGTHPFAVLSFYVSKAFTSDKLIRSNRIRSINLLVSGDGVLISTLVIPSADITFRLKTYELTNVNVSGVVSDNANVTTRQSNGDFVNVGLRLNGVSSSWALALRIDANLKVLAYQFDSSAKARNLLN